MVRIFISYASENLEAAQKVCRFLEEKGRKCWIAPRNIPVGSEYGEEIIKGIESSDVFVLIFSENSNRSKHVLREVERAVSKNIPIIVYQIDDAKLSKSMEYFLLSYQWMDAKSGVHTSLRKLNDSIDLLLKQEREEGSENLISVEQEPRTQKKTVRAVLIGSVPVAVAIITGALILSRPQADNSETAANQKVQQEHSEADNQEFNAGENTETELAENNDEVDSNTQTDTEETPTPDSSESTKKVEPISKSVRGDSKKPVQKRSSKSEQPERTKPEVTKKTDEPKKKVEEKITDVPKPEKDRKEAKPETEPSVKPVEQEKLTVAAGEYLTFGRYFPQNTQSSSGEIVWQVLNVDEKNHTMQLISDKILDLKPFDCAESGEYDRDLEGNRYDRSKIDEYSKDELIQFRGSNVWKDSDLRAWLNASDVVKYSGKTHGNEGTDEHGNGFGSQKGFLSSFTKAERNLLVQKNLEHGVKDYVYLLSVDEVRQYEKTGYFQLHPEVTEAAAASDTTSWYNAYKNNGITDYIWATRSPSDQYAHQVYIVGCSLDHETFTAKNAAASGLGIRPVITIHTDGIRLNGEGSLVLPYQIQLD